MNAQRETGWMAMGCGRGMAARTVIGVCGVLGAAGPGLAQPCGPGEATRLVAIGAEFDDRMGQVIALSADGSTLAAGASRDRVGMAQRVGTVSVFERAAGGWVSAAKLQAGDFAAGDEFGCSVALSADGRTLAVGAYLDDRPGVDDAGAVYIFTRSGGVGSAWTEQAKLIAGTTGFHNLDYFGAAVAISADGGTLVVGAPRWDQGSFADEGALYVFTRSGVVWTQVDLLRSSFGRSGDKLGSTVAISADGAVIAAGAGDDDTDVAPSLLNAGSVAVYRRSGAVWLQEAKIFATGAEAQDHFGSVVSLSGDGQSLAVGMPFDSTAAGAIAGSVRTYTYAGSWMEVAGPAPSGAAAGLQFGFHVSLSFDGSTLLAGSWDDAVAGQIGAGSVYIFDRAGPAWGQRDRLLPPEPTLSGHFGIATAIADDGTIGVGEYRYDAGSEIDAGAAWVFGASCRADLNCDGIADFADYLEFLNLYDAQDPAVDFNGDGVVDFSDYLEFLNLYDAGC